MNSLSECHSSVRVSSEVVHELKAPFRPSVRVAVSDLNVPVSLLPAPLPWSLMVGWFSLRKSKHSLDLDAPFSLALSS